MVFDRSAFDSVDLAPVVAAGNAFPPALATGMEGDINLTGASIMGKYFVGWLLGVPVVVLVVLFIVFR